MRADAARNRGRLLEAAASAFAEQGLEVPVAEIARRACVGPGTLFRHFDTKEDLIAAIVQERIEDLLAVARRAAGSEDAWAGLVEFLTASAELHAKDRGLMHAIKHRVLENPALHPCRAQLLGLVAGLVERAQAEGSLRADLAAPDVPFLLSAVAGAAEAFADADPDIWRRYLGIVLDGLRADAATPLPVGPPDPHVVVRTAAADAAADAPARTR